MPRARSTGSVLLSLHVEDTLNIPFDAYWALLRTYLRPQWPRVALLALLLLASIGLQLVNPQIIRAFIDAAREGVAPQRLTQAALAYLGIAVLGQSLSFVALYLSQTVAWTATNALRRDLALHTLRLDMTFHKAHTPGELIERIDGDVHALTNFFSQIGIHLLSNGLLALGILIALSLEDRRVALVALGYAALTATVLRVVQQAATQAWGDSRQAESKLFGFFGERLAATEDLRANGAVPYVMHKLYGLMRAITQRWLRAQRIQAHSRAAEAVAFLLTQIGTLAIGATLLARGEMSVGTVFLLVNYLARLRWPLIRIRQNVGDLQRARASIERIQALLNTVPRIADQSDHTGLSRQVALPQGALRVAFHDVRFRYEDSLIEGERGHVLHDISFELAPEQVLGLLGRTGSGKTTLARLLFRLYDPTAGRICLDDVDLVDLPLSALKRRVGLVTQDVQLFHASVRHNVSLFDPRISDGQILDAFHSLGLWSWYQSLPDGLDTLLQAGGGSLSAGEAQLLAFTRVLLKDPGLIILDEASSRLDPATERLLETAIDRLLGGRTAIVIAHRLATVERADEVMVLEDGRIQERGRRLALARDPNSRFYALLQHGLEEVLA
jgi:ABC-type multidrug transport system fused ATPase/permease subunit